VVLKAFADVGVDFIDYRVDFLHIGCDLFLGLLQSRLRLYHFFEKAEELLTHTVLQQRAQAGKSLSMKCVFLFWKFEGRGEIHASD
jgi:hypothetical protein